VRPINMRSDTELRHETALERSPREMHDLRYDLLRMGICSFNAGENGKSCVCDAMPLPSSLVLQRKEEAAYLHALESNYTTSSFEEAQRAMDSLEDFLLKYGTSRTIGQPARRRKALQNCLGQIRPHLVRISDLHLLDVNFSRGESEVLMKLTTQIYDTINTRVSVRQGGRAPTVAGKVMHILQPRLYVIWDRRIREARGLKDTFEGYWDYLQTTQEGLREALDDYRNTSHSANASPSDFERVFYQNGMKPITKLYDEACYAMVRGWLHFG